MTKGIEARTASVLLSDAEVKAIEGGMRALYRPHSLHWDGQFHKFLEPKQATLMGFEVQDIVHMMMDTGRVDEETGRPIIKRVESRVIARVTDGAVFPEAYEVDHGDLKPGDPCWLVVLREKVG